MDPAEGQLTPRTTEALKRENGLVTDMTQAHMVKKLREDRLARERARINKLRMLNLSKYNSDPRPGTSTVSNRQSLHPKQKNNLTKMNEFITKNSIKSKSSLSEPGKRQSCSYNRNVTEICSTKTLIRSKTLDNNVKKNINNCPANKPIKEIRSTIPKPQKLVKNKEKKDFINMNKHIVVAAKKVVSADKTDLSKKPSDTQPKRCVNIALFERLSQPKHPREPIIHKEVKSKPVVKRQTMNPVKNDRYSMKNDPKPIRRSISAIHFKKVARSELKNCFHKSNSVGKNLNLEGLEEEEEEDSEMELAVKSDRKKSVKFTSPMYRAPHTVELKNKLKSWLVNKGKPLDSYHHLQCFGVDSLSPLADVTDRSDVFTDAFDDKENFEVPDNASYTDNLNDRSPDLTPNKWRENESMFSLNTTVHGQTPFNELNHVNVTNAALSDLLKLAREGFDPSQCSRWLRAIRSSYPACTMSRFYWECRATLDAMRGDLPAATSSWQVALRRGSEPAVADASLDCLLDKFMQLNISSETKEDDPISKNREQKLLDIKNVFKSTIIKFAVRQARSEKSETNFTATPVRRSHRLSSSVPVKSKNNDIAKSARPLTAKQRKNRTPLVQLCGTLSEVATDVANCMRFVPNKELDFSP